MIRSRDPLSRSREYKRLRRFKEEITKPALFEGAGILRSSSTWESCKSRDGPLSASVPALFGYFDLVLQQIPDGLDSSGDPRLDRFDLLIHRGHRESPLDLARGEIGVALVEIPLSLRAFIMNGC